MAEEVKKIYRLSTGRKVRVSSDKEAAFLEKHPNAEFIMVEQKDDIAAPPLKLDVQVDQDATNVQAFDVGKFQSPVTDIQGENLSLGLSSEDTSLDSQEYEVLGNGIKSRSSESWMIIDWLPELDKEPYFYEPSSQLTNPFEGVGDVEEPQDQVSIVDQTVDTDVSEQNPPYVLTNEAVVDIAETQNIEYLPEWMQDANVYSLIDKYQDVVTDWTNRSLTSEQDFWDALYVREEREVITGTTIKVVDGMREETPYRKTVVHKYIGNVKKSENPELYEELKILVDVHETVEGIKSRDIGGMYTDLSDERVLMKYYSPQANTEAYNNIVDEGTLPRADRYSFEFNQPDEVQDRIDFTIPWANVAGATYDRAKKDYYTITDYENHNNEQVMAGFQIYSAEALSKFKIESQKTLETLQLELTEEFLPGVKTKYATRIAEETKAFNVIADQIKADVDARFAQAFANSEPSKDETLQWENLLKEELEVAQEKHFASLNKLLSNEVELLIKKDQRYKDWEEASVKSWSETQGDMFNKYVADYKYDYDSWETNDLQNIGVWLEENYKFSALQSPDQTKILDAVFKDYIRKNNYSKEKKADLKNEFYHYFYDKLTHRVQDGNEERTQFYYKGVAKEILRQSQKDYAEAKAEYEFESKFYGGVGAHTLLIGTGLEGIEKRMAAADQAIMWAEDVIENPEKYDDMGGSAFWSGFTSHRGYEYIPFVSGFVSLDHESRIVRIQDKVKKRIELSSAEKSLLQMAAVKQESDKLVSDISLMYDAGSMLAHSVPFIGEFIVTSGAFSGAKVATQTAIRGAVAANVNRTRQAAGIVRGGARVSKDGSKVLFAKLSNTAKFVDKMAEPIAMLTGVTAQTLANPIRIAENTATRLQSEMLFAFTTDADDFLSVLNKDTIIGGTKEGDKYGLDDGEAFGEALLKGFGISWAEIFTENLGAYFAPLSNKAMSKLFSTDGALGSLVNNNEFLSRIALGRLMRRYGFTKLEEFTAWSAKAAGWNGFVGEFMEEMVNMPMSNLITGDAPIMSGILEYDKDGNMKGVDWRNLGTIGVSVGAGAGMFSGGAVLANKVMGNKSPSYYVNNFRFDSWKDASTYLRTMKAKGLLNTDLDIEIQNDYVAYNEAADYLKKNGVSEDIIKVNKKGTLGDQVTATEIEIQNETSAEQRRRLDEIDKEVEALESQSIEEQQSGKSKRAKTKAVNQIQAELAELNKEKDSIIKPIINKIESKKSEKVFKDTLGQVEKINAALRKSGKKNVKITRRSTKRGARNIAMQIMFGIKIEGVSQDGTVRYIDAKTGRRIPPSEINEEVMNAELDAAEISHGYFVPGKGNKKGEIIINQEAALNRRGENVAAHEFLHFFLNEALEQSAEMKLALGTVFQQYVNNIDPRAVRNSEFRKRLGVYSNKPAAQQAEEAMALFLDAMANGELQYNETVFTKLGDILRHVFNRMGFTVKLNTGRDVYNFLKDFNKNIQQGELSASMIKAMEGTIEIGGQVEAVADMVSESVNKNKEKLRKELSSMVELETGDSEPMSPETFERLLDFMSSKGILFSKDATNEINELGNMGWDQESWESQGANYALETMITEQMLDGLIAAKLKFKDEKSSAEIETFIADVYAKLSTHVKNFNKGLWGTPQQNDSLYGWVNSQLANKANEVWNEAQKPTQEKWAADIEATTSEGAPLFQIAAEQDKLLDEIDNITLGDIVLNEEQKVIYSQFRQDLGLSEDMMNVVRDVIVQTFGRKLPKVGSKQFKAALEEAYRNELKTPIQDMMGKGANYDLFLEEKFEIIYTQLSKETLLQMERRIPEELRIFTRNRRITKPTEVDALIEQELLPKGTNRLSGPNLIEKLPYPGTEKIMAFFRGKNMQEVLGYKKGASTLGTRKDGLAKYIGQELAFDATFEVLERDNVQDRFLETIEMTEGEVLGNEIAMVLKQIDRQPGIMFSKSKYEEDALTLHEEVKVHGFENIFPNGKLSNEYKDLLPESVVTVKHVWETGKVSTEEELRFKDGVLKIKGLNKADQAVLDAYGKLGKLTAPKNIRELQDLHRDNMVVAEVLTEENMDLIGYDILGYVYRVMDAAGDKTRSGKPGESGPWYEALETLKSSLSGKKGKSIDAAVSMMNKGEALFKRVIKIQDMSIPRAEKIELFNLVDPKTGVSLAQEVEASSKANIEAAVRIAGVIIDLSRSGKISKMSALHLLQIQTGIVKGFRGLSSLDLIEWKDGSQAATVDHPSYNEAVDFYLNENNIIEVDNPAGKPKRIKRKRTREEAEAKALWALARKGEHLAPNSNTMLEIAKMLFQENPVTTEQIQTAFKDHSQFLGSKYLMDVLDYRGGKNNKSNFDRIKFLNQSDIDAVAGIQGGSFEDVLLDRALSGISFSKAVDKSNGAKLKNQQNARLTYNENTESKGMSTFDFDETLIIEGENFITATHPKTGEVTKISSGNWPLEGPKMAAQGYQFDFSDFVNVRGGVEGPLLQKMRNQIEKYGADNVFVLTARQQESATAIYEWLKTQGINLPFKNITGLGKSEGSAKGEWMLQKYAEGYNDMYFVDDALPNVEAVKKVLEALDIKSKVVQARIMFSKDASGEFNEMLERNKDVGAKKTFSAAEARRRGAKKGRFEFFIPPSAEDFKGLMYKVLGRGKQGEQDLAWIEENLITPYAKGIRDHNAMKQKMASEFRTLRKKAPGLKKNVAGTNFTVEQAIRVYLFDKAGFEIPGLAKSTKNTLINHVNNNSDLINYAGALSKITRTAEGYMEPTEFWDLGTIASDMRSLVDVTNREGFLAEWKANRDAIFSEENINKLEAIFGTNYRDALENMLYRMETGSNRTTGANDKVVNSFLDWINGSVGTVMFFNTRSAILQTISTVNFLDFEDNNVFQAAGAFANAPQFWKDFAYIFNSDTLKQRRSGLQMDVNAEELTDAFNTGKGPKAVIQYLLQVGFTPTQLADSFAISLGGASYYRNKVKANIKRGMSQQEAEAAAWLSFQEKSEETQQSSRPDFISQQQAGVLGRLVLAWQNTPMQMTRLMKKATLDLINGRGDVKSNVSKIIYYGVVQNIIFGTLQSGLMFAMFGDDEDEIKKKETRVANGVLDTLLRGTGVYGAAVSTIKNVVLKWQEEREKGYGRQDWSKISQEIVNLSPPMGSKHRKILGSVKGYEYNEDVIAEMDYGIDNPMWNIGGNVVEGITNIPLGRVTNKANNIDEAINGNMETWQRAALLLGWNKWDVGVKDADVEAAKEVVKEKKEIVAKEKREQKKIEKEAERVAENEAIIEGNVEEQEKQRKDGVEEKEIKCAAIKRNGERCGKAVLPGQTYCTVHEKVEQRADGEKKQCTHVKANGDKCKMQTSNKSGKCYYHD